MKSKVDLLNYSVFFFLAIYLLFSVNAFSQTKEYQVKENDKLGALIKYDIKNNSAEITKYFPSGKKSETGIYYLHTKGPLSGYVNKLTGEIEWGKIYNIEGYYKFYTENGLFTYFYENENKKSEGNINQGGRKEGKWIFYYANGKISKEVEYDQGFEVSKTEYKDNGETIGTPEKQGDTLIYSYREDEKYYIVWETNYFKIEYAGEPNSFTEFRIVDKDKLKTIIETKKSVPYEGYSFKKYPINLLIKEGKSTNGEWGLCEYKNGLKHGKRIDYNESFVGGISAIWEFENGIYKRLTAYYPNGFVWQIIIYDETDIVDKIPESYYITEFYMEKKDVKKSEGKMIKPYIQDGKWLLYDINGRVDEKEYKNGVEVSK